MLQKSLPPLVQVKEELKNFELPAVPSVGKGMVYVVRPSSGAPAISFDVYVRDKSSGNEVGSNGAEEYIYFEVNPGVVKILSVAENTAELEIEVETGMIYYIVQNVEFGILFARNSINTLSEIEGMYRVKNIGARHH